MRSIIATPNFTHKPIALAAAKHGKHVMCEKPLGLDAGEVRQMYHACRDAGVVHMTAFTYRFAPSMRYLRHLLRTGELGQPRHFRSQRFLDLPETSWGWRQYKSQAGAGDLFDMTIHRIDFAIDLLGPVRRVCGAVARFVARDVTKDGSPCPPSEVDDWSSLIGEFDSGAVGVWEGTTLAKGYGLGGFGHEWAEINGSQAVRGLPVARAEQALAGAHRRRSGAPRRAGRIPEAGREPPRSHSRRPGHGVPLRPDVGVRLGDRRRARRRAQFLRRTAGPGRRRRGSAVARAQSLDRNPGGTARRNPAFT